jgi:anaerobic ribonucleoside-triphosphate reductase activating protein
MTGNFSQAAGDSAERDGKIEINSPVAGYRASGSLNLAGYVEESFANGPGGPRAVVWTQGCQHACRGCQNPDTWDTEKVVQLVKPEELAAKIMANPNHRGVTYSGGEPFLQARGLAQVSRIIRASKALTTVCYSGFTYEELTGSSAPDGAEEFLKEIDLLIDGRYVESLKSNDPKEHIWRGSANQRLIWIRPEFLQAERQFDGNVTEIHVLPNGTVIFTGFGGQAFQM